MGFKLFRVKIISRIILLGATIGGFTYFIQKKDYYFTSLELLILAILLAIELIYFIEKGYRQLNGMLQSVKEKDFNISFKPAEKDGIFVTLARLLNELTEGYREVRIEKEVHYQFLNHIVDHVNQVLVCFDLEGKVILANLASRKLLKGSEIKHISSFEVLDPQLPSILQQLVEGQEKVIAFTHKGERVQYAITSSSIKLLDKQSKLVVMHDISQPLREQELESYRKLIRVLTHEIMNSVTPILSLSEAMNDTLRFPDTSTRPLSDLTQQESIDLAEGYQAIETRSRALMRFVNDFRSLTKLPEPNIAPIDVDGLIKPIASLFKPILDNKGIKSSLIIDRAVNSLMVDKDLIEQVLINLIKNAIDALEGISTAQIDVEVYASEGKTIVTVSDNGIGITPESLDSVFVPFYSTKAEGSGIGLSLSLQIMRLHSGTIKLKSTPGQGSVFMLIFPNQNG